MMIFLGKLKRLMTFVTFLILLGFILVAYSLYEENRYYESCQELGLECSRGKMHEVIESAQAFLWQEPKKK